MNFVILPPRNLLTIVSEWNMFSCTCSQEELGFATFRLSNSSLGSKNSSLGPSALGMNFSPLGWITAFRLQNPILPSCSARNYIIFPLWTVMKDNWKRTNSALSWYLVFSSDLNWDHSLANFLEISAKDMSGVSFRTVSRRSFRKWTYPDNGCFGAPGLLGYLFFPFGHPRFLTSVLKI